MKSVWLVCLALTLVVGDKVAEEKGEDHSSGGEGSSQAGEDEGGSKITFRSRSSAGGSQRFFGPGGFGGPGATPGFGGTGGGAGFSGFPLGGNGFGTFPGSTGGKPITGGGGGFGSFPSGGNGFGTFPGLTGGPITGGGGGGGGGFGTFPGLTGGGPITGGGGFGTFPGIGGVTPGFLPGGAYPGVAPPSDCRYWCRSSKGKAYCCESNNKPPSPVGVLKPGVCPPVRAACPLSRSYNPPSSCSKDGSCSGYDKCCYDECLGQHTCKAPYGFSG